MEGQESVQSDLQYWLFLIIGWSSASSMSAIFRTRTSATI